MSDPSTIDRAILLLWAAHTRERTADCVTNIGGRTRYIVTGKLKDISISDDEQFSEYEILEKPQGHGVAVTLLLCNFVTFVDSFTPCGP